VDFAQRADEQDIEDMADKVWSSIRQQNDAGLQVPVGYLRVFDASGDEVLFGAHDFLSGGFMIWKDSSLSAN